MNLLKKYWKSVLVSGVILFLSFAKFPASTPKPSFVHFDKIVHFAMYFVLTITLLYDYANRDNKRKSKGLFFIVCVLYPVLLGAITELGQGALTNYRQEDPWDFLSNLLGVMMALAVYLLYKKTMKNQ